MMHQPAKYWSHNVLIMTGDFNIRDSNWDPSYSCNLTYSNTLREVADSLNLELSTSINLVPTWYVDNCYGTPETLTIFILFYFIFLISYEFCFSFFFFSFGWWRGMWHHKPRTWWKDLEDDIRAHVYNMVVLGRKWSRHENAAWTWGQA